MKFEEEFLELVAKEVGKSPIVSRYVAEHLYRDPDVLKDISAKLDATLIAENIAKHILWVLNSHKRSSGLMSDDAIIKVTSVMKQAQAIAAEIIADKIVKDTLKV